MVEGDYALSVNNCQADAIPAAVCGGEWVGGQGREEDSTRALQPGWPRCGEEGCRGLSEDILPLLSETQGWWKARGLWESHKPAFKFWLP